MARSLRILPALLVTVLALLTGYRAKATATDGPQQPAQLPAPAPSERGTPPQLVSVHISPATIDVSSKAAKCAITLALKASESKVAPDNGSGTYWAVTLSSPSHRQERVLINRQLKLTEGTPMEGVWTGEFTMPQYSESGIWELTRVAIDDEHGNHLSLASGNRALDGASLTVYSQPADITPPEFTRIAIEPSAVTPGIVPKEITITITARDDISGVDFVPDGGYGSNGPSVRSGVDIASPSGGQKLTRARGENVFAFAKWNLISGTPRDGVWQTEVMLPANAEPGIWKIRQLCLKDAVRNSRCYSTDSMDLPSLTVLSPASTGAGAQ